MEKNKQAQTYPPPNSVYWKQSAANLLRMGHCAPTVMQTILDVSGTQKEWLVKLIAGMPGGIGNTGFECGAITSPLVLLGLHYGLHETGQGLPVLFDRGYGLCQRFVACLKTLQCKQIRGKDNFPKHCIRPVCLAPQMFFTSTANHSRPAIPAGYSIPPYYDSLVGKLIVHGRDRQECLARLARCLGEIVVGGIDTNISLFQELLANPEIVKGDYNIHWLERWMKSQAA